MYVASSMDFDDDFIGTFDLGGAPVINGNTGIGNANSNVFLENNAYIALSTDTPPAPGMNIGVRTATLSGVIVNSGANASHAQCFHADEPGRYVVQSRLIDIRIKSLETQVLSLKIRKSQLGDFVVVFLPASGRLVIQ